MVVVVVVVVVCGVRRERGQAGATGEARPNGTRRRQRAHAVPTRGQASGAARAKG